MFKKLFLLSLFFSTALYAETLSDVLALTYQNNLGIQAARAGQKATDELTAKAKAGYRPNVYAQGSIGRTHNKMIFDDTLPAEKYNQTPKDVSLRFSQPIFSGLSTFNEVHSAKQQVKSSRENLHNTEQVSLLDAVAVYMDVIRDTAVLELTKNNEEVLKKHLESTRKKFKVGDLTRTDVAQSEARLSQATANRIAAEGNLKVSKANFFNVVLEEPDHLEDVKEPLIAPPDSLEAVLKEAAENNPKIKAAVHAEKAAQYTVKSKKGKLLPLVSVNGAVGQAKDNSTVQKNDYWQITADATVPLFQSGAEYADIRQAKNTASQYRLFLAQTRQQVQAEATNAWENYQSSKAQIKWLEDQIKASETALKGVIREQSVGTRTVLDVLDAEQEHLNSQVALVKAHRDEVVSAYALLGAIGQLTPKALRLPVEEYDPKEYYDSIQHKWIGYGTGE